MSSEMHHIQRKSTTLLSSIMYLRMAVETDKNRRLTDDLNQMHRRVNSVESELLGLKQVGDGKVDFQHLQREMDKLIRENEDHKHRYE